LEPALCGEKKVDGGAANESLRSEDVGESSAWWSIREPMDSDSSRNSEGNTL
jgi:hypothetical protein